MIKSPKKSYRKQSANMKAEKSTVHSAPFSRAEKRYRKSPVNDSKFGENNRFPEKSQNYCNPLKKPV